MGRKTEPAPGELAPYIDRAFAITCGEYSASAVTTAFGWSEVGGHRRTWHVVGPDYSQTRSAGLDWAAALVWSLHHDIAVHSGQCEGDGAQAMLDIWIENARHQMEAFVEECGRLCGNPRIPCLPPLAPGVEVGTVYQVAANRSDLVKIGFTDRPMSQRLRQMQTGSPTKLRLVSWFPGTLADERAMHRRLARFRERGEWFRDTQELREVFEMVVYDRRVRARVP